MCTVDFISENMRAWKLKVKDEVMYHHARYNVQYHFESIFFLFLLKFLACVN